MDKRQIPFCKHHVVWIGKIKLISRLREYLIPMLTRHWKNFRPVENYYYYYCHHYLFTTWKRFTYSSQLIWKLELFLRWFKWLVFLHACLSTYFPPAHFLILNPTLNWNCSLRQNYGGVSSLRIGSHKLVMASTPEAVKEILVTRSADFAGRQRTYSLKERTLGMLVLCIAIQGS